MANGHGGPRQGGGRKPKAIELKAAEKLRSILEDEVAIMALAERVKIGDMKAIELWLAYVLGKPTDKLDVTSGGQKIMPKINWINPYESD